MRKASCGTLWCLGTRAWLPSRTRHDVTGVVRRVKTSVHTNSRLPAEPRLTLGATDLRCLPAPSAFRRRRFS